MLKYRHPVRNPRASPVSIKLCQTITLAERPGIFPLVIPMTKDESAKEARILRMVKKVLTDIAKDTYTPPQLKHPLSDQTIKGIRECLALITARETELAEQAGKPLTARPHFVDEKKKSVVVPLDLSKSKKKRDTEKDS